MPDRRGWLAVTRLHKLSLSVASCKRFPLAVRDLKTDFQAKVPLQEAGRALQQYVTNMTAGKVLLMP